MLGVLCFLVFFVSALFTRVEAQDILVNGIGLTGTHSNLNITIDLIEFRQGDDSVVRLTTGRKHYGLSLLSRAPIPMFDAELPLSNAHPNQFTVAVEDAREFRRCLVKGLSSSGSDSSYRLAYSLACEDVSPPPEPCSPCK